jgi:hypothetical protein
LGGVDASRVFAPAPAGAEPEGVTDTLTGAIHVNIEGRRVTFVPDAMRLAFLAEGALFVPSAAALGRVAPTLERIRVAVLWVGRNRFMGPVQIRPEHMPEGREDPQAIRVVHVLGDGRLTTTVGRRRLGVEADARGILWTRTPA